ncbi:MAG: hypothetical protein HY890_02870 [Deltaproteobacteria bacterium]|nr:hypothetical protein [Deltaproteobacteria bacterium]
MRDAVALVIGSSQISNFVSYSADSNVLTPADCFSCKISRIDDSIEPGKQFGLYVNGSLEMTGVIDSVKPSYAKGSQEMEIVGRDYMGLLIDSSVEEYKTLNKMELKELAKRLLKNVNFIDSSKIMYGNELTNTGVSKLKKPRRDALSKIFDDTSSNVCQWEPGVSIFEALSDYAQRRGLLMWMEPDGILVFGELRGESDTAVYNFYTYTEGDDRKKNNIISASRTNDISKRFSKITTIAQIQGSDSFGAGEQTVKKISTEKDFPFAKPLVMQSQCSSVKAAAYQVQLEMKKREVEGWRLEIVIAGHSQDGVNYRANTVCHLRDEVLGELGNYLVLGRKLTMDRQNGPRTELTIGKLMKGYTVS